MADDQSQSRPAATSKDADKSLETTVKKTTKRAATATKSAATKAKTTAEKATKTVSKTAKTASKAATQAVEKAVSKTAETAAKTTSAAKSATKSAAKGATSKTDAAKTMPRTTSTTSTAGTAGTTKKATPARKPAATPRKTTARDAQKTAEGSAALAKTPATSQDSRLGSEMEKADPLTMALRDLVQGNYGDPFALLGAHRIGNEWNIRVYRPDASDVTVRVDGKDVKADKLLDGGLFVAKTPVKSDDHPKYTLMVTVAGQTETVEDPYRFGPILGDMDLHFFGEGTHERLFEKMGAHPGVHEGVEGVSFTVWAPNASRVSVVGDFNSWDGRRNPMRLRHSQGVWELFIPGLKPGALYKYELKNRDGHLLPLKADPFAFRAETPPHTASMVHGLLNYQWHDKEWMDFRQKGEDAAKPVSIYEVHLGSWMRVPDEGDRFLTYRELAERLVPYVKDLGFSHIELLPITEFPYDGSWGYRPISLFAPTSRFGSPEDFAFFVDACHEAGIGVILDWVPAHFPTDAHGLANFDGTHLYEHADPRQGMHRDWGTLIYNYGRPEVANFLAASAQYWLENYHIDGLRVDAVASMLYLDYSRDDGEWIPNRFGGNENLDAIEFLKRMNILAYRDNPGAITVAEESTAWPAVSRPTYVGGLGFGFKWNMGWMHDTLRYISKEPVHRSWHHNDLTFGLLYAFSENFILPLSHDEVVHGKSSLIGRMPGDQWQRFANLRAYYAFMWAHPGKKLLFMGGEFGQNDEWNHDKSLDWHLTQYPEHAGIRELIRDLNRVYRDVPALHELDSETEGFSWIEPNDAENSVIAWCRRGKDERSVAIVICNFTPVPREEYRLGVPEPGWYVERINSDSEVYAGSNLGNGGGAMAEPTPWQGLPFSLNLTLPPLSTLIFELER